MIFAREFYPFTRTNDIQYHLKYLKLFHSKLKQNGFVILQMVILNKGFCNTYYNLDGPLKKVGFSFISRDISINNKFFSLFGAFSYKNQIYRFLKLITRIILKERTRFCYILAKK